MFDFTHLFKLVDSKHETSLLLVSFVYFLCALFFGYLPLFLVLFICGDSTGHRWSMVFLDLARVQNSQITLIFLDMLDVCRIQSELISNSIAEGGPFASKCPM